LQKTELTQQAEPHEAAEQGQGRGLGGAGLAAAFEGSPGVNFINSILAEKLNCRYICAKYIISTLYKDKNLLDHYGHNSCIFIAKSNLRRTLIQICKLRFKLIY
jgi:hypothetical protein